MDEKPAAAWWNTFEVNILGVYNTLRSAAKYLRKTNGYFFAMSSIAAQLRWPGGSDYQVCRITIMVVARMLTELDDEARCK